MNTEPITTKVIVREGDNAREQWTFAMEDKSYNLSLLAYGRYITAGKNTMTQAFFHPWQADESSQMHLTFEQVPMPEDVVAEAKESLIARLGYNDVDLPEDAKKVAVEQFLSNFTVGSAETPKVMKKGKTNNWS